VVTLIPSTHPIGFQRAHILKQGERWELLSGVLPQEEFRGGSKEKGKGEDKNPLYRWRKDQVDPLLVRGRVVVQGGRRGRREESVRHRNGSAFKWGDEVMSRGKPEGSKIKTTS